MGPNLERCSAKPLTCAMLTKSKMALQVSMQNAVFEGDPASQGHLVFATACRMHDMIVQPRKD